MLRNLIILIFLLATSCNQRDKTVNEDNIYENDFRLFQGTSVWNLAKYVQDQNINKIKQLIKEGSIDVDFQEPKYGNTLLMLAVKNQKYQSSKVLLELGANPNKSNKYDGASAMIDAAAINTTIRSNTRFLELLLAFGGNSNYVEVGERKNDINTRSTPLIIACGYIDNFTQSPIDKVKLLVESGADINYTNEFNHFALKQALIFDHYDVVLYLLENGADYSKMIYDRSEYSIDGKTVYIADILRERLLPRDSKEYEFKMKIVNFLNEQGLDYRSLPIPDNIKSQAK